jgi:hypothetical protein
MILPLAARPNKSFVDHKKKNPGCSPCTVKGRGFLNSPGLQAVQQLSTAL